MIERQKATDFLTLHVARGPSPTCSHRRSGSLIQTSSPSSTTAPVDRAKDSRGK